MGADLAVLNDLQRYDDVRTGVHEEFVSIAGLSRSWWILSRPVVEGAPVGWVVAPSLGREQHFVSHVQAILSRALSAAGLPVLRPHRIYDEPWDAFDVDVHGAAVSAALAALTPLTGAARGGIVAIGTGSLLAAAASASIASFPVALWEPARSGEEAVLDLARGHTALQTLGGPEYGTVEEPEAILDRLATEGSADLRGFELTETARRALSAIDPAVALGRAGKRVLILSLSASSNPTSGASDLADRLRSAGANVALRTVQDRFAPKFMRTLYDGDQSERVDIQVDIAQAAIPLTLAWCLEDNGGVR